MVIRDRRGKGIRYSYSTLSIHLVRDVVVGVIVGVVGAID